MDAIIEGLSLGSTYLTHQMSRGMHVTPSTAPDHRPAKCVRPRDPGTGGLCLEASPGHRGFIASSRGRPPRDPQQWLIQERAVHRAVINVDATRISITSLAMVREDGAGKRAHRQGSPECACVKVRRLRIQQRIKSGELGISKEPRENEIPNFPSFIPFLPPLSSDNLRIYYASCFSLIAGIIVFGGLLAPTVDPIVASFSGGAVGVISAMMVVEINNVKLQEHKRCKYCLGTGYLACARCSSTGALVLVEPVSTMNGGDQPLSAPKTERCSKCSGSGKVMCPTCLCTGMAMASEHDPRIDPFD